MVVKGEWGVVKSCGEKSVAVSGVDFYTWMKKCRYGAM